MDTSEQRICTDCTLPILDHEYCVNSSRGWVHTDKKVCSKRMAKDIFRMQNDPNYKPTEK